MVFTLLTGTLLLTKITIFFFTEIAVYSQSIEFADSGNHDDVSYSSITVVKRLNTGAFVLIRTPAESNLASNGCLAFNLSSGFRLIHTTKRYFNKCKAFKCIILILIEF